MIIRQAEPVSISRFSHEVFQHLPLAEAVLSLWSFVMQPEFLEDVFERNRGRSFCDVVTFPMLVELIGDALLQHGGSGRQAFVTGVEQNVLSACPEAVYGKLRRVPLPLSQGFFADTTDRLRQVRPEGLPPHHLLPESVQKLTVVVVDGKTIKQCSKRLLVARGKAGKVYGGKLLAAYVPAEGLVRGFLADPDGETNEAKLIPQFIPSARELIAGPRLWVLDRQFCDLTQPRILGAEGDHFVVRYHPKTKFYADESRETQTSVDAQGRTVFEEWGWLGSEKSPKGRLFVRRIHLLRPDEEEVIVVTDLLGEAEYPAVDLLAVYLERWGVERVFQQITEVFHLDTLIGSTPQATIFQAAFCLNLYNMLQVMRQHVAAEQPGPCDPETLSLEGIFNAVIDELKAVTKLVPAPEIAAMIPEHCTAAQVRLHLSRCLRVKKLSKLWVKAVNKKPRPHIKKAKKSGAHTSVARLIKDAANQVEK